MTTRDRGRVEHLIREVADVVGVPAGAIIGDAVLTLEAVTERGVEDYVICPGEVTEQTAEQTAQLLGRAQRSITRAYRPQS